MSSDSVALIKDNLALSTLVARYITLVRKGGKLAGCCPLHNEKTPSFYVDDNKGFFHCFGCGRGGDLIQFAMDIENFSFVEALDFLADMAGVELPKQGHKGPSRDTITGLREIYTTAVVFYQQQLGRNKAAQNYLIERGVKESTISLFKLGFAPSQWDALLNHLRSKKVDPKLLQQSGLFKEGKTGKSYDIFRDRIMFPIRDAYGHTIAFGGRLMEGEGPKYINSPESPLYTKGKHVFNLDFAKNFLKKKPEVVVTEGYMDVIQVYQAGIGGVIAGLGTAFTADQARLLKRHCKRVILNYDADTAGFKAARVAIETFLDKDMEIAVLSLPDKQDPDDFIKANGSDVYREQIASARGFYDFLIDYLSKSTDLESDPRQRSEVVGEMTQTLHHITDPVVQAHWLRKLATDLNIEAHVVDEVFQLKQPTQPRVPEPPPPEPVRQANVSFNHIEAEFLFHVMHRGDFTQDLTQEHRDMLHNILSNIFRERAWILEFIYCDHSRDFEEQLATVPEEMRPILRSIFFDQAFQSDDKERLEALFGDLMSKMLRILADRNKQRIRLLLPTETERKRALLNQNFQIRKQEQKLKEMV